MHNISLYIAYNTDIHYRTHSKDIWPRRQILLSMDPCVQNSNLQ